MASVLLTRSWFGPDGVRRRKGRHEVPDGWVKGENPVLPKSAKVLSEADEKAEAKTPAKK